MLRYARARLVEVRLGERMTPQLNIAELSARAHQELVLKSRKVVRVHDGTFLGSQLVDWLLMVECLSSRDDAVNVGNAMIAAKRIAHVHLDTRTLLDGFEPYCFVK